MQLASHFVMKSSEEIVSAQLSEWIQQEENIHERSWQLVLKQQTEASWYSRPGLS